MAVPQPSSLASTVIDDETALLNLTSNLAITQTVSGEIETNPASYTVKIGNKDPITGEVFLRDWFRGYLEKNGYAKKEAGTGLLAYHPIALVLLFYLFEQAPTGSSAEYKKYYIRGNTEVVPFVGVDKALSIADRTRFFLLYLYTFQQIKATRGADQTKFLTAHVYYRQILADFYSRMSGLGAIIAEVMVNKDWSTWRALNTVYDKYTTLVPIVQGDTVPDYIRDIPARVTFIQADDSSGEPIPFIKEEKRGRGKGDMPTTVYIVQPVNFKTRKFYEDAETANEPYGFNLRDKGPDELLDLDVNNMTKYFSIGSTPM